MDLLKIFSNYLVLTLGLLAFLALWVFSVMTVSAGVTRRNLPTQEKLFWLALVIALPLAGFLVYMLAGLARSIINSEPQPGAVARRDPTGVRTPPDLAPLSPQSAPVPQTFPAMPAAPVAPPAASARCYLTVIDGPASGTQFALLQLPVRIGRGEEAQVRLEADRHISRRHAEIYQDETGIYIRDLGSMHGTQVNGAVITSRLLKSGDRIVIGDSVLQFMCQ